MEAGEISLVPGRSCGGCTMCCKVMEVEALAKPAMQWCAHCTPGAGCKIYDDRPTECRAFLCEYLLTPHMPEFWAPARSRMVIVANKVNGGIAVHVDPSRKDAWRKQPYYGELKAWAATLYAQKRYLIVLQGGDVIAVMPNADKRLGRAGPNQMIHVFEKKTPQGMIYDTAIAEKGAAPQLPVTRG